MKAYSELQKTFGNLPSGTCGLAFGATSTTQVIHVWTKDNPEDDDACLCGAFYYRAAIAHSES